MDYDEPVVATLDNDGGEVGIEPAGTKVLAQDVAVGLAYVFVFVVLSQFDATP